MQLIAEIKDNTRNASINKDEMYKNLKKSVLEIIRTISKKGTTSCTIDVDHLVRRFMTPDTKYSDIAEKLEKFFISEHFGVKRFSIYKEESITISW